MSSLSFGRPLLPVDNNEHWELFSGVSDISFCNDAGTFTHGSPEFEAGFRKLTGELMLLLKRMRNGSTPVFVYPYHPSPSLKDEDPRRAFRGVSRSQSFRLLPDRLVNLSDQVRKARSPSSCSARDTTRRLTSSPGLRAQAAGRG